MSHQEKDLSCDNDHAKIDPEPWGVSKKVFTCRNSLLTDLVQKNLHIQSVYNMLLSVSFCLMVNLGALYMAKPSIMWEDLDILSFTFSGFSNWVIIWILLNLIAFAFYEAFKLWIHARNISNSKVADRMFLLLYIAAFFGTLFGVGALILKAKMGVVCHFALAMEQVRIYMNIHSYIRENISREMQHKLKNDDNEKAALYPNRKHYLYYLFAPTLIYRDSYPRTKEWHLRKVLYHLSEILLCMFVAYCNFFRLTRVMVKNVGLQPITSAEATLLIPGIFFSGIFYIFTGNYGILHTWPNFTAEVLRFGDREFYRDWWNSENFMRFHRTWNICVYDWLIAYVYADLRKLGCSRIFSQLSVFLISSFFHEYVMFLTLGYLFPLIFLSHINGFILGILTPNIKGIIGNINMLSILFLGQGLYFFLYTLEFYARKNCPKEETMIDFFKLRILDTSCQIFDFSSF